MVGNRDRIAKLRYFLLSHLFSVRTVHDTVDIRDTILIIYGDDMPWWGIMLIVFHELWCLACLYFDGVRRVSHSINATR